MGLILQINFFKIKIPMNVKPRIYHSLYDLIIVLQSMYYINILHTIRIQHQLPS